MAGVYPWIISRPVGRRQLPPEKPTSLTFVTCGRCGWQSERSRRKCPACLVRLEVTGDAS